MKSDLQRLRRDRDSGRGVMVGSGAVPASSGGYRAARPSSGVPAAAVTMVESAATPAASVATPAPSAAAAPTPAAAAAPKPQPAVPKAKPGAGNKNTMIAIGGGVLLLLIAIAGFAFWKSSGSQPEPATTQVAEAPPEPAPPATPPTDVAAPAPEAGTPLPTDPAAVPGATPTTTSADAGDRCRRPLLRRSRRLRQPPPRNRAHRRRPARRQRRRGQRRRLQRRPRRFHPRRRRPLRRRRRQHRNSIPYRRPCHWPTDRSKAKQYEQALANLQGALGRKPGSSSAPQANLLVARIYDRQRRTEAAMAAYEAVKTRYPRDPVTAEALFRLAELVQDTRQPDRLQTARGYLDSVVNDFGSSSFAPRALQWRAAIEDRQNLKTNDSMVGKQVPTSLVTLRQLAERYPSSQPAEEALWKLANQYRGPQTIRSGGRRAHRSRHALPPHALRRMVGSRRAVRKTAQGRRQREAGLQQGPLLVAPLSRCAEEDPVKGSQGRRVARSSGSQGRRVARSQGRKVSRSQGRRVARVARSQGDCVVPV